MNDRTAIIILSTADYDSHVWTNKQHLATLVARSFVVIYVGSVGLRRPRVNWTDTRRVARFLVRSRRRIKGTSRREITEPGELVTVKPIMIPFHGFRAIDRMNSWLLTRQLRTTYEDYSKCILWTFSPYTFGQESHVDHVVYQSVDLLHEIPGIPGDALQRAERLTCEIARYVIASSTGVMKHLKTLVPDRNVLLWENVADTSRFTLGDLNRSDRAIFAGHITASKLDMVLLHKLASSGLEIALAGPVSVDGTKTDVELQAFLAMPNVKYLGNLELSNLARELQTSKVGLIPYTINSYTAGVFPMKVYEYLATGLNVVSTALPSLADKALEGLTIASDEESFVNSVLQSVRDFTPDAATQRSDIVQEHSWESRSRDAVELINVLLDRR